MIPTFLVFGILAWVVTIAHLFLARAEGLVSITFTWIVSFLDTDRRFRVKAEVLHQMEGRKWKRRV